MRRKSRGISKFLRVQGSKFSSFSGSGIKLLGKKYGISYEKIYLVTTLNLATS